MNYKTLSEGLRSVLNTRGITYKELSVKLNMSESGVKKMLTGEDIAYNKLAAILGMLELKFEDLVNVSPKVYESLTSDQENFFVKHPKHLNFFNQFAHYNLKPELVKKANPKLSKEKMAKYLGDLEKIKVIQLIDGVYHSLLCEGYSSSDKLYKIFGPQYETIIAKRTAIQNDKWKSWMFDGIGTLNLSQKSALELRNEMKILLDEFSVRSKRERNLYDAKDLVNSGVLFLNIPLKIEEMYPII